jgi:predicted TIM-barrel fold metal-dependent hydrolase
VPVIDFHCHAGMGDGLTDPADTRANLGTYLKRAQAAGIDRTVVFPTINNDYRSAMQRVAELVDRLPERLTGFAMVNTRRDKGSIGQLLDTAIGRYGFRGVKVHGHQGMPTRELCDSARRHRIPVLVDVFDKPWHMDMCAREYADLTFVVAHLGSFRDDWRIQQAVIDLMVRFPNICADTSGVRRFEGLQQALRRVGPRRLLFGSDGPWFHPGLELHKIRLLGLSPLEERLVMGGNAARLLRLERPVTSLPHRVLPPFYSGDRGSVEFRGFKPERGPKYVARTVRRSFARR